MACDWVRRRLAAWALPRPSATASAKFANNTVNHSHRLIWPEKDAPAPTTRSRTNRIVVATETISTTNMTGLRHKVAGLSFLKDSPTAGPRIEGWNSDKALACVVIFVTPLVQGSSLHREMLGQRPERDGREIGQPADDRDDADQQSDKQTAIGREGAGRGRRDVLRGQRAGDREHRNDHEEAADQHREADRRVVEGRVRGEPAKGAAVVAGPLRIGVEPFAEAVRPGIRHAGEPRPDYH